MRHEGVTVLLAVYNGGAHLPVAVASVLAQTYRTFELLVVDDGSTDGTSEWLAGLEDPRVRVVRQDNKGLVAALNRGLAETRTELVARMDADDVAEPTRLERQVRFLEQHPDVAAVGCCYRVVDEHGTPRDEVHVAGDPTYLARRLYFRNTFAHASMTFRRSAVEATGGYRDVGPAEDYDLWVRLAQRHALAALPEVLLTYRDHDAGISASRRAEQLAGLDAVRDALHRARPVVAPPVAEIVRQGRAHRQAFEPTCPHALATYVFDHAWLAIHAARRRRLAPALRFALAVLVLVLRHPSAVRGMPGVGGRSRQAGEAAPS